MPEGKDVWQNDLLESRARSRGDVIFSEGGGLVLRQGIRINLACERRRDYQYDHHITPC